jgi:type IV pilus assembly protein PilB
LTRRICSECKQASDAVEQSLQDIQVPPEMANMGLFKGQGCSRCSDTGYKGRVALYEVMSCGDELKEYILQGYSTAELKQEAVRLGMVTLRRAGIKKMFAGMTTPEEVVRNTAPD